MQKIKLYVYPNAQRHVHDDIPEYRGVVPLCEEGINKWCELVPPDKAEYFYMGQLGDQHKVDLVRPQDFKYFNQRQVSHIMDLEGDWTGYRDVPEWLHHCILTVNGLHIKYKDKLKAFVRPTFSKLLLNIIRGENPPLRVNRSDYSPRFAFRGFADQFGVRNRMLRAAQISGVKQKIQITSEWRGSTPSDDKTVTEYKQIMEWGTIGLAPRGAGLDSVRFLEACHFQTWPILIGDNEIVGDTGQNFYERIPTSTSIIGMSNIFKTIAHREEEIEEKATLAKEYFETTIRDYFRDPTLVFIEWLRKCGY